MTLQRWIRQMLVVLKKELKDASRDRRAVYTLLISSAVTPLLLGFMFNRIADRQRQLEEVSIPVVGIEHAPALIDWMRQQAGVTIVPGPTDPEIAVKDRNEDVVVVISPEFAKKFRGSSPAQVKIVSDGSRTTSRPKVQRVRGLLQRYSGEIGSMRLVARGVSPSIATAIQVEDVEVSSAQQRAAMILNFIPLFIVIAAFTGGMHIAMDSTAGERERGSLESLLTLPVQRETLIYGKILATCCYMLLSLAITLIAFTVSLKFVPLESLGMSANFGPLVAAKVFAVAAPFVLLGAGLMTVVASFTRSYKEAQSYLTAVLLVPTLPIVFAGLYSLRPSNALMAIPSLSQHLLMTSLLRDEPLQDIHMAISVGMTLLAGIVLAWVAGRLYRREAILG